MVVQWVQGLPNGLRMEGIILQNKNLSGLGAQHIKVIVPRQATIEMVWPDPPAKRSRNIRPQLMLMSLLPPSLPKVTLLNTHSFVTHVIRKTSLQFPKAAESGSIQ